MKWLLSQVCYPGYEITVDELLDRLEDEFEKAKQNFDDRLDYDDIPLPGRPFNLNRPDRGLIGSAFRLSRCVSQSQQWSFLTAYREARIEIFTKQAENLIQLVDKQIRLFRDRIKVSVLHFMKTLEVTKLTFSSVSFWWEGAVVVPSY